MTLTLDKPVTKIKGITEQSSGVIVEFVSPKWVSTQWGQVAPVQFVAAYDKPVAFYPTPTRERAVPTRQSESWRIIPERKALWIEALRSGAWEQIRGTLVGPGRFRCAMGIAFEVSDAPMGQEELLCAWLGLSKEAYLVMRRNVIDRNDSLGQSFAEIADYIERMW